MADPSADYVPAPDVAEETAERLNNPGLLPYLRIYAQTFERVGYRFVDTHIDSSGEE